MPLTPLAKKLQIKPSYHIALINVPAAVAPLFDELPAEVTRSHTLDGIFDLELIFVSNQATLQTYATPALAALQPAGVLWFAYPKQSAKVATDIHRDKGWDVLNDLRYHPVTQIAIDPVWSALRFRRNS